MVRARETAERQITSINRLALMREPSIELGQKD